MRASPPPRIPPIWKIGAIVAVAALYLLTRQRLFTIDSLYYLWDTEFGTTPRLLHPHHLALQPIFRAVWQVWTWFEWPGRAVLPLQLFNVGVTLGVLAVFWRLLRRLRVEAWTAGLWWFVLALCFLPWKQATQTEGFPLFALMAVLLLERAVRLATGPPPTARTAIGVAAALAGGVLVHQALVLWSLPLAWMIWRQARRPGRWFLAGGSLALAGATVLACYVIAGGIATGGLAPTELWAWFTGYSEEFAGRNGQLALMVSSEVPRGLATSVLSGLPLKPYLLAGRPLDGMFVLLVLPFLLVVAVLGLGLVSAARSWRELAADTRRAAVHLIVLALVAGLFASWWDPGNRKFWGPVLVPVLALAALGWTTIPARGPAAVRLAPMVLAGVLLGCNLLGGALPRHRSDDARQPLLVFLTRTIGPDDVVILAEDRVWQCAVYFRPDRDVHGLPGPFSDRDDPQHTVWRRAIADAEAALRAGEVVYVDDREWDRVAAALTERLGTLPPPQVVLEFADADLVGPAHHLLALGPGFD